MSEPEEYDIECPECGAELTVPAELIGSSVECPNCGDMLSFAHEEDDEEENAAPPPQRRQKTKLRTGGKRRMRRPGSNSTQRRRTSAGRTGARSGATAGAGGAAGGQRQYQAPASTSGMAIASLVCSLLPFFCITPLLALIFGIIALVQISGSQGRLKGTGMAVTGLILSILGPILLWALLFIPVLGQAREKARQVNCAGNLKQIGLACLMFSGENSGAYPDDLGVLVDKKLLQPGKVFSCPSDPNFQVPTSGADIRAGKCSYKYLGKGARDDGPYNLVIAYCDKHKDQGQPLFIVLCSDGHVEMIRGPTLQDACASSNLLLPGQSPPKTR